MNKLIIISSQKINCYCQNNNEYYKITLSLFELQTQEHKALVFKQESIS